MPAAHKLAPRDFWPISLALAGIILLSWLYLLAMAHEMSSQAPCCLLQIHHWSWSYFNMTFVMWTIMMIGMMLPSAIPMTLIYAAVARKAHRQGTIIAPTGFFVLGYIFMWTIFSLAVTFLQWQLDRAALLSPLMVAQSPKLGAAILIAAGIYQWLPIKDRCLTYCHSPFHFMARHWQQGFFGAFKMGIDHGVYCVGCCWVLMLLLFVGGVMNILWIALISLFVMLEKFLPLKWQAAKITGMGMVLVGLIIFLKQ